MKRSLFIAILSLSSHLVAGEISFNKHVRPILSDKCYFCHGPDAAEIKGGLQLHTLELATSDRKGEGAAIVPGKPEESLLWQRVSSIDPEKVMPPPERHAGLTKRELQVIKQWIKEGAEYEELWSFQPLPKKIPVPPSDISGRRNDIDNFVHQALKTEGLKPSPEAPEDILLRRLYLTLTGLVPTVEQIKKYKADQSGRAYENLVDELLKSQDFAERLAVDWMDVARYADSYGYQRDNHREVWLWRDWVLKSFKANMPYDQFVKQQLAGDLMPDSTDSMKLATAFNRLHMQKNEGGSVPEEFRTEYVADRAQTAATAFMGLTMECCRCHDHKYDPVSMKDYYSMYAFFNNIDEAGLYSYFTPATPTPTLRVMSKAEKSTVADKKAKLDQAMAQIKALKESEKTAFTAWKESWDGKVKVHGRIARFDFEKAAGGKIPNLDAPKAPATYAPQYSKIVEGHQGKGAILDGDSPLKFGAIGPYARHLGVSYSFWMNTPIQHKRAVLLHRSRAWDDAASRGYELLIIDGKLNAAFVHFHPGNEIRVQTKAQVRLDQWQHVTVTYDGSSDASGIKIYIGGKLAEVDVVKNNLTDVIHYRANKFGNKGSSKMEIEMGARFRDRGFKKSSVDDLRIFNRELTSLEVRSNHSPDTEATDDQELYAYYLANESTAFAEAQSNLLMKRDDYNVYVSTRKEIMTMVEMPVRRKTYLLERGHYSTPDKTEEIVPAPPKKVFPFGKEYSRDRLGLAKWLTHPDHPLTARVTVNRYWQMVFGQGLVRTTNDFGMQGDFPSHPELLDYLSRSFVDSEWNVRALVKKMVMSQTFRQDSLASKELQAKDPENRLLSHGPSYFLSAEMLRDSALKVAGILGSELGGKSVKPYAPTKGLYRKSLYTYWKRNDPSPEMMIFGAPRRQICSVKREKTSTPLQPLVLMNSPQVIESCRNLAAKIMAENLSDSEKLRRVFLTLTSREISDRELEVLEKLLIDQRQYFKTAPKVSTKLSKIGAVKTTHQNTIELATWTVIVNTVMNLDAFYMLR